MTLHGVDLSHFQAGIRLANTDAQFALFKASQGHHTDDSSYHGFVSQARDLGLPFGAYHFAENDGDLAEEADHFLAVVHAEIGDGLLVLDWEKGNLGNVSGAKTWLDRVHNHTGITPLIYMSQSTASGHDWSSVADAYSLWVARYNDTVGPTGAWDAALMWQYTDAHKTGGYTVDANRFYGTDADWHTFASGGTSETRAVWDEHLTLWVPTDADKPGDEMPAGQQLNQTRGYAQSLESNTRQIKAALRALAKDPALGQSTENQMRDVLD